MIKVRSKFKLAFRIIPVIVAIVIAKMLTHWFGLEFLSLSSLFAAIISANTFLIGFLVSGVLSDYKESEKIPTDISSNIESIADEGKIVYQSKNKEIGRGIIQRCSKMCIDISAWFANKKRTNQVMDDLESFNNCFIELENISSPPSIARLKTEQNNIRKMINRAHTIKDTNFIGTGYAIAEIITVILISGFVFMKVEPFYEGVFFISFVSYMLIYMIYFIKNLDNPFEYGENESVESVSLKPFSQTKARLDSWLDQNK